MIGPMKLPTGPAILLLACGVGCGGGLKRVPGKLVDAAPVDERRSVARLEADFEEAGRNLSNAKLERGRAELARFRAEQHLRELELQLEGVEKVADRAKDLGLEQLARDSKVREKALEMRVEAAEKALDLAEAEDDLAARTLELRVKQRYLADAELEAARASAARAGSSPEAQTVSLGDFQSQLASAHEEVADAQSDTAKQTRRVQKSREKYERALAQVPKEDNLRRELETVRAERDNLQAKVKLLSQQVLDLHEQVRAVPTSTSR